LGGTQRENARVTGECDPAAAKAALRERLLERRRGRPPGELAGLRRSLAGLVLATARRAGWRRVAGYQPLRTEPGSVELLQGLRDAGVEVLVPVTLPDRDLDWERWPAGRRLGVTAVATVDAVLVPALAAGRDGTRLGRGGGSYDRALARAGAALRVALLFDDELLESVPREPWDVPVHAAATPTRWVPLGGGSRRNTGVAPRA